MSELRCKKCQSTVYVKSGYTRGIQRYKCNLCGALFTDTPRRGVHPPLKAFSLVLYAYCGFSMERIARLCKVSKVAVLKWIHGAELDKKAASSVSDSELFVIDEVWRYVDGKKVKYRTKKPLVGHRVNLPDGSWAIVALSENSP